MATLRRLGSGHELPLAARHVIGRSRSCQLQVERVNVSALHAEIVWDGRAWLLRDLGSRNGTYVDGRRIAAGDQMVLELGAGLAFGIADPEYQLVEAEPPRLMAFGPDGVQVTDEVLRLPTVDEWEAMVFRDADGRWLVETSIGTYPVENEQCVVVSGQPFVVHLPGSVSITRDSADTRESRIDDAVLELMVSRDGEHVDLRFRQGDLLQPIESRAHAFLLLALARARATDSAQAQLPESEHGWMHREDLMRELSIQDPQLINLWVHRARQQFSQLRVQSAWRIIERREGAGQLRIGLQNVLINDA